MFSNTSYGLVLGGGGARGAYQIGAFKALHKLGIQISSVSGASIGAINGAFFAQGDLKLTLSAWRRLNLFDIVRLEDLPVVDNLFDPRNGGQLLKVLLTDRGLDMDPLRELMHRYIDEEAVRKSPISLGILSYDMTSRQPVERFVDEIPEGSLYDYLLASACLPVFKTIEIDGSRFLDGGFYNNIPIDMLAARGIHDIIVIDVGGIELVRPPKTEGIRVITIRPQVSLGGILDMSFPVLQRSIKRGMLDTYRAFGKLSGNRLYLSVRSSRRFVRTYGQNILDGLEIAAERYGADPLRVYTPDRLVQFVRTRFCQDSENYVLFRRNQKTLLRERLLRNRPRLGKIDKEFLIPATVELLGDPTAPAAARDVLRRLFPAPYAAAEALFMLGIRLTPTDTSPCEVPVVPEVKTIIDSPDAHAVSEVLAVPIASETPRTS